MAEPTKVKLTMGDQFHVFVRSGFEQAAWNYPRLQNMGFCYLMIPAIRRLYPNKADQAAAAQRHLELFNTMPYMQSLITGVTLAMEEDHANGKPVTETEIKSVKVAMMGSLAGVADPVWWGIWRPLLSAFAATLVFSGFGIVGPLTFFIGWNVVRLGFRWLTQRWGYRRGISAVTGLQSETLRRLTEGASIVGLFVMGAIVPRWTQLQLAPSFHLPGGATKSLQAMLDQLLPGVLPLCLTLLAVWLLRHRVRPLWLFVGVFVIGIGSYWIGLFH